MGSFDTPDYELPDYLKGSMEKEKKKETVKTYSLLFNGRQEFVMLEDYLKVVELKDNLSNENKDLRNLNIGLDVIIEELRKELKTMSNLCNERGKEIKSLKRINKNLEIGTRVDWKEIDELRKEIEEMKNNIVEIKCCQGCAKFNYQQYLKDKKITNENTMEKYVLAEDCVICKWKVDNVKNKFGKHIEETESGFVDSWMLSYKVEGMKEPIVQHHLTKEECEIIYGNMNNITYWFMEVMGK